MYEPSGALRGLRQVLPRFSLRNRSDDVNIQTRLEETEPNLTTRLDALEIAAYVTVVGTLASASNTSVVASKDRPDFLA